MATFQRFEDIEAWKKARQLTKEIYALSNEGTFARDFGLKDQIRRAAVSVMSNIAEGFERSGTGDFLRFLAIAKGSAGEVRSQLYVAYDLTYVDEERFGKLADAAMQISKLLAGLMGYLKDYRDDKGHSR
jgi:four helix bundle protein